MSGTAPGFAVYVHWPFCETICPYCDFNVHAATDIDQDAWREGLIGDLSHYAAETPGRTVTSLYFGGGTPSLMPPDTLAALIRATGRLWRLSKDAEITLELNPTSAERARLADFRDAGVNRVSLGVQALDDAALAFLGRTHSVADALAALESAGETFRRVTFDLIYARPGQSLTAWRDELGRALTHAAGHLSLYQLGIESGTPFFRSGVEAADEDTAADMFEATQDILAAAGMPAYEISNHARPGGESRHNLTCWRGGDYVGAGPGAHGRLTLEGDVFATHQIHTPARWLEKTRSAGHGTAKRRALASADRARELLMMGLRLSEGIDIRRFENLSGVPLDAVIDARAATRLVDGGLIQRTRSRFGASAAGRQRLNAVIRELLA